MSYSDFLEEGPSSASAAAGAKACALALVRTGWVAPGAVLSDSYTHLMVACEAGLPQVVSYWLEHHAEDMEQCMNVLDADGDSAFSKACSFTINTTIPAERRAGCRECAVLLSTHPALSPSSIILGTSQLSWACIAGLDVCV
jgi:hypothetical protein